MQIRYTAALLYIGRLESNFLKMHSELETVALLKKTKDYRTALFREACRVKLFVCTCTFVDCEAGQRS